MEIVPIFENGSDLWCVFSDEHNADIITVLFEKWDDTDYLVEFLNTHISDLSAPYWNGISIDTAVNLIREEVMWLQEKLICIESPWEENCKGMNITVKSIFENFYNNDYVVNNSDRLVKGKAGGIPAFLRLYGVELSDGTIIISGGAIKLTGSMNKKHLIEEKNKLIALDEFLAINNIKTVAELK
jgi:hypothetical protein